MRTYVVPAMLLLGLLALTSCRKPETPPETPPPTPQAALPR